jgi:hypothetical protein
MLREGRNTGDFRGGEASWPKLYAECTYETGGDRGG